MTVKKIRKKLSVVLALVMTMMGCFFGEVTAVAATVYDAKAALTYAAAHWNDGKGQCAEFVSNCINQGGCSAWSRSCTDLRRQLLNSGMGTEYELKLQSDMSIKASDYEGKLAAGDVVFYYCGGCTDGKPYIHTVLCNGQDSNGYMKAYSHNNANNGQSKYKYSSKCYACGTKITKAYVYHFNTKQDHAPIGCIDSYYGGSGVVIMEGWTFDQDTENPIEVHMYVGGPAGSGASGYSFVADKERGDVDDVYGCGGYHGFSETVWVKERGVQEIYLYAINPDSENHTFLGSRKVTISDVFEISLSQESIDMTSGDTADVNFGFKGDGIYTISCNIEDGNIVQHAGWKNTDYQKGESGFSIKANNPGTTNVSVRLLDSNMNILYEKSIRVTVQKAQREFVINFGTEEVVLDAVGQKVAIPFVFKGDGIHTMAYAFSDDTIGQATAWGATDWREGTSSLEIEGIKEGETDLYIKLLDEGRNVLFEKSVRVKVNAVEEEQPQEPETNDEVTEDAVQEDEESNLQKAEKYVAWMTEIGRDLGVSDSTLKKYVKVLLERLGLDEYTYLVDSV